MPFYEYECQKCGRHHEVLQKISDAPLRKCPDCGKPALKRLVSAPVFRLTGSGWYETDFKSDKEAKRNLAGEKHEAGKAESGKAESGKVESGKAEDTAKKDEAKPAEKASGKVSVSVRKPPKAAKSRATRRAPAKGK